MERVVENWIGVHGAKLLNNKGDNMIEAMLTLVLGLVIYNSKLWEDGMWETTKSKWVYWRSK